MKWCHLILYCSWKRLLAASVFGLALMGCADIHTAAQGDQFTPVGITGVQHIGRNFNVAEFYVDGYYGSNVGRGGGGGSSVASPN